MESYHITKPAMEPGPSVNSIVLLEVNAVNAEKKKSDKERLAASLKNLGKACACKAMYKAAEREAALARGEVPAPAGNNRQVFDIEPINLKQLLKGVTVEIPLVKLLYHLLELHQACGQLLGYGKKPVAGPDNEDQMNVDFNHLKMDTSSGGQSTNNLQSVCVAIEGKVHEFLIDGGAMVLLVPLQVVQELGRSIDIQLTDKVVRFGDGAA